MHQHELYSELELLFLSDLDFFALLFFFWLFDLAGALEVLEFGD